MTNDESNRARRPWVPSTYLLARAIMAVSLPVAGLVACSSGPHEGVASSRTQATVPSTGATTDSPSPDPTPSAKAKAAPRTTKSPSTSPKSNSGSGSSHGNCAGYPTPACTGTPAGTSLSGLRLNLDGGTYRVTKSGTVLNGVHIRGDLLITANNVTIRNSQIDGGVLDEYANKHYSFTIADSTVGPEHGCLTSPGIGEANYTATGVLIRGHGDGFRDSGDNITIRNSYVHLCSNPGDHSDGIQTYMAGRGLVFDHNTIDQRDAKDVTAPIFLVDNRTADVRVTNNLVMGGTYSIQLKNARGSLVVQNNRLVNRSWIYGPVESDCGRINWSGNTLVTIDHSYRVTSTVGPLPCAR
jgi:hypothetical protein